jgi:biotin transport system substrate-specific component
MSDPAYRLLRIWLVKGQSARGLIEQMEGIIMSLQNNGSMATAVAELPALKQAGLVLVASWLLAASSWVSVPMVPVPMTMQTLAVCLVGAMMGPRLGTLAVLVWFGQAIIGLPLLAGGSGGAAPFFGPTAGYLVAFPIAAWLTGVLVSRGWDGQRPVRLFIAMLIANGLCLALGGAWLARLIGSDAALATGVLPFILGGILKSALGAAMLAAAARWQRPRA